jgi:hypothetical protein
MHRPALGFALAALLLGGLLAHAPVARAVGVWAPAAAPARDFAGTTPLQDGRVLGVAAFRDPPPSPGSAPGPIRTVAEVYDSATDRWSARSPLPYLQGHDAPVLLPDGRVLFTGGEDNRGYTPGSRGILRAAQVYDPVADSWTPVAPMGTARHHHPAALLADGTVLVAGGDVSSGSGGPTPTATAERYDPRTDRWFPAAPFAAPRLEHTLTPLRDGRVLAAGGVTGDGQQDTLATAEIYDPVADRWTAVTGMAAPRRGHTATPLADGRVLVAGGTLWESETPSLVR